MEKLKSLVMEGNVKGSSARVQELLAKVFPRKTSCEWRWFRLWTKSVFYFKMANTTSGNARGFESNAGGPESS